MQEGNICGKPHQASQRAFGTGNSPLDLAARTKMFLPSEFEQISEEFIAPLCWSCCPRTFKATADCIFSFQIHSDLSKDN